MTARFPRLHERERACDAVADNSGTRYEVVARDSGAERTASVNTMRDVFDDAVEDVAVPITSSITEAFHLSDFYSAHLLNYCEGSYMLDSGIDGSASDGQPSRKVTACSSLNISNTFDPPAMLEHSMQAAGKIAAFHWPNEITTGFATLEAARHAMVALYLVSIAAMVCSLMAIVGSCVVLQSKLVAFVVLILESTATAALGLATILVTLTTLKSAELINSFGRDIGLDAKIGVKFLGLVWAAWLSILTATALLLLFTRCGKALRT